MRVGIDLGEREVEDEVANLRKHFATQQEFEAALANRGMTPRQLRNDTRRTLLANRLLEHTVWRDLEVTPAEIEHFYREHQSKLDQPLDELRDSIGRMLLDEKKAGSRAKMLSELRRSAVIKRFPPFASATPATTLSGQP